MRVLSLLLVMRVCYLVYLMRVCVIFIPCEYLILKCFMRVCISLVLCEYARVDSMRVLTVFDHASMDMYISCEYGYIIICEFHTVFHASLH